MTLVLAVLVKNLNTVAEDKFLYGRKLEKLLKLLNWKKLKLRCALMPIMTRLGNAILINKTILLYAPYVIKRDAETSSAWHYDCTSNFMHSELVKSLYYATIHLWTGANGAI